MVRRVFLNILFILSLAAFAQTAVAGTHEVIHPSTGESIGWGDSEHIPYWFDKGPLGILSNEQASALVDAMMGTWDRVDTALVGFEYQGQLADDVTIDNVADYLAMTTCGNSARADIPKDVVPIVFDTDGKIIDYVVGMGASSEVGGLSTLRCFNGSLSNPTAIYQGMLIINGQFIDGKDAADSSPKDLSVNALAGVMLHELGHMIGIDHTALNEEVYDEIYSGERPAEDSKYLPVMLPTVLRSSTASTTLRPDDIAAISTLYPADGYLEGTGNIKGEVLSSSLQEVRKVNVVARNVDDPLCEVYSGITGRKCLPLLDGRGAPNFNVSTCANTDLYGDYIIEGLMPGDYTVEVAELDNGWTRKGIFPSQVSTDLPGDAEFYNEGDMADDDPLEFSLVSVTAAGEVDGINMILNRSEVTPSRIRQVPLSEFTPGPSTRCYADLADYGAWLDTGDLDTAPNVSGSTTSSKSSDLNAGGGSGGGCTLTGNSKGRGSFMFMLATLIVLLIGRFLDRSVVIPAKAGIQYLRVLDYRASGNDRAAVFGGIILLILLSSSVSFATTIVPIGIEQMALKSGKIFQGKCVDVSVEKDEHGLTSTYVTYEVIRGVKGADERTVTFKVFGVATKDAVEAETTTMVGGAEFTPGTEEILFLYDESPWGFTSPVGLWQGAFEVKETPEGKVVQLEQRKMKVGMKSVGLPDGSSTDPDKFLDNVEQMLENTPKNQ